MPAPTLLAGVDTSALRRHCEQRWARLEEKRRPWLDYCRRVADELLSSRLPYLVDPFGEERGGEQNTHIVDAVGPLSLETAAAGISTGTMPSSSQWFHLLVRDQFSDDDQLLAFLEEGERRLLAMHNQSNASQVFPEAQKEWLAFGTAAALLLEDDTEDAFRVDPLSIGEYCIADDHRGRCDTLYRKLTMTVGQLAEEFGKDRLSPHSATAYARGDYDVVVPCVHAIEPDRDGKSPFPKRAGMPWRSVYFEQSQGANQVLAVRGYRKFPALVWRWSKLPGTAYGYGRGQEALPHLVRLRKLIYRFGQALAYKTEPPLQLPPGMSQHEVRALPGGKTSVFGQQPITTLFQVNLDLREVAEEIERTRQDIRDTMGATLVASLRSIRHQMTAREADLRTSQDLQEFLPGLYRLNEELLNPYIEWLWDVATERGILPPLPPILMQQHNQVIDIEFTSPLARKQRASVGEAIVRTYAVAGEIAKVRPDILDNLNVDEAIREVAQIEGAPITTLYPLERVRELRAAREQTQLAEQQAAAAQTSVDLARGVAETERLTTSLA
jgi:hypothetical protein